MLEIDFGEQGQFPNDVAYSIYLPDFQVDPPDIRMNENERLRRLYLMAPGLTALTVSAIDFLANGRISELGGAAFFLGAIWTIVGYGVGTQAALDSKARTIGAELKALDDADEEFKRLHPDKWALLYPVSAQREREEKENLKKKNSKY